MSLEDLPRAVEWKNGRLFLLDQTRLPGEVLHEDQKSAEQVRDSIRALKVRGAPAIGVAAAYGLCVAVRESTHLDPGAFRAELGRRAEFLNQARPTAVNLSWALQRMCREADELLSTHDTSKIYEGLVLEAQRIHEEDLELSRGMGRHGAPLIKDGMGVLTHCNAGSLATSFLGTATAPMYVAQQNGVSFRVYADETRPLLQGARLTAWELQWAGIDVTLITDNMAAHLMSQGKIDLVLVGTDRVAANGDVANKIGTLGVAILARHFDIPFYVACPSSTWDVNTPTGAGIPIEEREEDEVTSFGARRTAPVGISVCNPAFDVTPHQLVTGLITERGIVRAPLEENLKALLG